MSYNTTHPHPKKQKEAWKKINSTTGT